MLPVMLITAALSAQPVAIDVEMTQASLLGKASPNTLVVFQQDGVTRRVISGDDGTFVLNVRPGICVIETQYSHIVCRVWREGTAPPSSQELVLRVVRGQDGRAIRNLLWKLDSKTMSAIIVGGSGLALWAAIDSAS